MIDISASGHYVGDCRDLLARLPDGCVQTCITSPPYWGLRSYLDDDDPAKANEIGLEATPTAYVETIVAVFHDVRRALADDGTLCDVVGSSIRQQPQEQRARTTYDDLSQPHVLGAFLEGRDS